MTALLSLSVSVFASAEEAATATLVHTAGGGWSSSASNTATVDAKNEYYNMDVASGWAGAAFAKFTFSIPEGHSITEATLTWACTQYGGSVYTSNIYYLNAGSDFDFDNATTASDT